MFKSKSSFEKRKTKSKNCSFRLYKNKFIKYIFKAFIVYCLTIIKLFEQKYPNKIFFELNELYFFRY